MSRRKDYSQEYAYQHGLSEREQKLPNWAKDRLIELQRERDELQAKYNYLEQAHSILTSTSWFTIRNPHYEGKDMELEYLNLWVLCPDRPQSICQIGRDDVLLIGRKKRGTDA